MKGCSKMGRMVTALQGLESAVNENVSVLKDCAKHLEACANAMALLSKSVLQNAKQNNT